MDIQKFIQDGKQSLDRLPESIKTILDFVRLGDLVDIYAKSDVDQDANVTLECENGSVIIEQGCFTVDGNNCQYCERYRIVNFYGDDSLRTKFVYEWVNILAEAIPQCTLRKSEDGDTYLVANKIDRPQLLALPEFEFPW